MQLSFGFLPKQVCSPPLDPKESKKFSGTFLTVKTLGTFGALLCVLNHQILGEKVQQISWIWSLALPFSTQNIKHVDAQKVPKIFWIASEPLLPPSIWKKIKLKLHFFLESSLSIIFSFFFFYNPFMSCVFLGPFKKDGRSGPCMLGPYMSLAPSQLVVVNANIVKIPI